MYDELLELLLFSDFFLFGDSVPLDDDFFLFGDSVPLGESLEYIIGKGDFILGSGDSPLLNIISGDLFLDGLIYLFPPAIFLFVLFNIINYSFFLLLCSILIEKW